MTPREAIRYATENLLDSVGMPHTDRVCIRTLVTEAIGHQQACEYISEMQAEKEQSMSEKPDSVEVKRKVIEASYTIPSGYEDLRDIRIARSASTPRAVTLSSLYRRGGGITDTLIVPIERIDDLIWALQQVKADMEEGGEVE